MLRLLLIGLLSGLMLALSACSGEPHTSPGDVTRDYWSAIQNGETTAAANFTIQPQANEQQDGLTTTVDGSKIKTIRVGEAATNVGQSKVPTTLVSIMDSSDPDAEQTIEVSFDTQLILTEPGWKIDLETTNNNMMAAAMQAAFGVMGQALADGMQDAMKGLGEAMAEGMQAVTEGFAEGFENLDEYNNDLQLKPAPYQAPTITPARITGLINDTSIELTKAEWSNTLALYSGDSWGSNPSLLLFLFLGEGEQPVARTITVDAAAGGFHNPHVHYRWRNPESGEIETTVLTQDYNLTLTLGDAIDLKVPGQISFSVPGEGTEVRGSFEIQLPTPQ